MEWSKDYDVLFLREMLAINTSGACMKSKQLFRRDPFLEMVTFRHTVEEQLSLV